MHVLVTRPEPEASAMAARLAAMGVDATPAPVLAVEQCPPSDLAPDDAGAVVATSRNALSALVSHPALPRLLALPLFVVGPGTAAVARRLGFTHITQGSGTASALSDVVAASVRAAADAPSRTVLVLRGEKIAYDLAAALELQGVAARELVVYRMRAVNALGEPARAALAAGKADGVALMSPETAKVFTMLVQGADLTRALPALTYFCLSPAVAVSAAAPAGAEVLIAERPSLEEMLALIVRRASKSAPKP